MVELHGWALIRENFTVDNEDENLEQIITLISQEIEKLHEDEALLRIAYSNGEATVTATKFTNHFSDDVKKIIDLFKLIAVLAPGSYGLLYFRDDEDTTGLSNDFQVFVLSKGTLIVQRDTFLSPYCLMVED